MATAAEQVQGHTQRLAEMRAQIAALEAEADPLGNEIAVTLAAGKDATALRARRAEVRELRADLAEAAELLEQQLTTDREAAGKAEAQRRMTGIARAYGSVRQELDDDEARVREAAAAYQAAAERVNQRFRALGLLKAEAEALGDRFSLAVPALPPVVIPAMREGCAAAVMAAQVKFLDHAHVRPETEKDEHGLRTRRTYAEIADTPSGQIITAAGGPKPWPELTDKQREIVAGQQRQRAQEAAEMRRFASEADRGLPRSKL